MVNHNGRCDLYMSRGISEGDGERYRKSERDSYIADASNCPFWRLVQPVATSLAKLARACRVSDVRDAYYITKSECVYVCVSEYRVRSGQELLQFGAVSCERASENEIANVGGGAKGLI